MELTIDTSDNTQTTVGLDDEILTQPTGPNHSQNVLGLINELLEKKKVDIAEITKISVNIGPGSFTGLRVGTAIANTLAWLLKVPVNDKEIVEPKYEEKKD